MSNEVPRFNHIAQVARRKLRILHNARSLNDLAALPGNRLRGDRFGQHSIRINGQYRVCFVWQKGDAAEVEVTAHYR
jgi:proteic killer suppression protein